MNEQQPDGDDRRQRRELRRQLRQEKRQLRRERRRHRILRSTAVLPSLVTVFNGLSGFGAIHFATKSAFGQLTAEAMENLWVAAWLIVLAMICDMLDGRLARMTRKTSDFGAQLDSLCDVISFGVAPAVMTLRLTVMAMRQWEVDGIVDWLLIERMVWGIAGIYVACAALRLARFNVENVADESAHMHFRGLPSPGAAAAVISIVLLSAYAYWHWQWIPQERLFFIISIVMSLVTLSVGLLMVSRFQYPHVVNQYIRGKKPFSYIVKLVIVIAAAFLQLFVTFAVVTLAFALSGPVRWAWRKVFGAPAAS